MNSLSPVIILGMHRSGTTLVAQLLSRLGLFIGRDLNKNAESVFFVHLNDWLFGQCGGYWDRPEPIEYLLEERALRDRIRDYLRFYLNSPRIMAYSGPLKYLRYRSPFRFRGAWGWKDPRNTFTLPLWLDLFPQARIIHICRHGVDVARSLQVREQGFMTRKRIPRLLENLLFTIRPHTAKFTLAPRCLKLSEAFHIWESYIQKARSHLAALPNAGIEIQYESFLLDPVTTLARMAQFCGLNTGEGAIERTACEIKPDRAYAYRRKPELAAFAAQVEDRLAACGYSKAP